VSAPADSDVPATVPVRRRGRETRIAALAWIVILGATVGLGLLGQRPVDTDAARSVAVSIVPSASTAISEPSLAPRTSGPTRTRPPIGEDGIMGGLPFGTAWLWLKPQPD
jgi:hypothetical protein